jgi:hypothetical protein
MHREPGIIKRTFLRFFDRLTDRAGNRMRDTPLPQRMPLIARRFGDSDNMVDEHSEPIAFLHRGLGFRYDAFVPDHQQACVVVE